MRKVGAAPARLRAASAIAVFGLATLTAAGFVAGRIGEPGSGADTLVVGAIFRFGSALGAALIVLSIAWRAFR